MTGLILIQNISLRIVDKEYKMTKLAIMICDTEIPCSYKQVDRGVSICSKVFGVCKHIRYRAEDSVEYQLPAHKILEVATPTELSI